MLFPCLAVLAINRMRVPFAFCRSRLLIQNHWQQPPQSAPYIVWRQNEECTVEFGRTDGLSPIDINIIARSVQGIGSIGNWTHDVGGGVTINGRLGHNGIDQLLRARPIQVISRNTLLRIYFYAYDGNNRTPVGCFDCNETPPVLDGLQGRGVGSLQLRSQFTWGMSSFI